jgi:serine/threonine protein kinase
MNNIFAKDFTSYNKFEVINSGTFGTVYSAALKSNDKKKVAIKVLLFT